MNLWPVLIAIALIVVSGLLIAAETAMTRVSKTRIDELRKEGNGNEKRAELLLGVLQDRARYVNVLFLLSRPTSAWVWRHGPWAASTRSASP